MTTIINNVLPLVLIFLLGVLLKRFGVFVQDDAHRLLKLFFYVSLPALILRSIPEIELNAQLLFLPINAAMIIFATYLVAFFCGKRLQLARPSFGVFLVGAMVMNGGFAFPFVLSAYGEPGMALATLFDFGGGVMVFTFVYYQACRYGSDGRGGLHLLRKFLLSPPLMALCIALFLNLTGVKIPQVGMSFLQQLAYLTTPVVLLALGIAFNPRLVQRTPSIVAIGIRMFAGCLFGLLCCELFQLQGLARQVTLVMSAAPSGVNTLVFSSLEDLDNEFAASIVSYATLLGMCWLPLLIYLQG
ncbi:hypothetical protein SAMN02745165_01683 [Malonomonas rubra DSM 5091]|uniref:AEC family transporter n=1 Tax=Malonomonas rubra DSM 5091 TaxID=1122189 RepID=A0A1M6H4Q3_MALRU|nr:AEC family transporter [Malonomonas rubra]SHJ17116.1 hypothetical protein SAMN02745165_01683 [Malonomonas rubra DSM 5091]